MKLGIIRGFNAADFDFVKANGLDFIESCRNNNEESVDFVSHKEAIKANIERTGIPIGSVGRWNAKCNVGGKIDADAFKYVTDLLDSAIYVKSPVFVCGCNYDDSVSLFKNYSAAIELFGTLLDRAKGHDIKIAVYNCDWENFVYNEEAWKVVLGELPSLMLKFDCSHSFGRRSDYLGELSNWGDRVAHMHVKGAVRAGTRGVDDPPAGMDMLNWPAVFAIIYSRGYNGGLSIEPHSNAWRGDSERGENGVRFTRDYIRRFMVD